MNKKSAIIGCITEIKDNENRVGLTPYCAQKLVKKGHRVLIQRHAGRGAGFHDSNYTDAGAEIMVTPEEIAEKCDILVKVKEPVPEEYHLLGLLKEKTLFTYLHLSGVPRSLTEKLLECEVTGIAYETVQDAAGKLPLLTPMSEIAGVLAVQYAAQYLQIKYGGRGRTCGKITGAPSTRGVIYGAGVVGRTSARTMAGMGSRVTLFDINDTALKIAKKELHQYLGEYLFDRVTFAKPDSEIVNVALSEADVLIGAVLVAGTKAPEVVSEQQIHLMKDGAVVVDVSIDQGGCLWGSKPTKHSDPIYELDRKIYCCVANMPGQVARQSTQALTRATLPYLQKLAGEGIVSALRSDPGFLSGLNTYAGKITYKPVAKDLDMMDMFTTPEDVLSE
jgi:alanine dehydrogenase